jgi:hypothetical protein
LPFFLDFVVFLFVSCGAMLTDFGLLAVGARAPRSRQLWRIGPDERRAPPAPGAA